jgi:hypothetical protein
MRPTPMLRAAAGALLLVVAASACGGASAQGICPIGEETVAIPQVLGGYTVFSSKAATSKFIKESKASQSYVCDASIFELRDGPKKKDELIAVLEVVRMTTEARTDDIKFLSDLAKSVVGNSLLPEEVGDVFVWKGEHNAQGVFAWFHEEFMAVLIVRQTTQDGSAVDPAPILAEAIELEPSAA